MALSQLCIMDEIESILFDLGKENDTMEEAEDLLNYIRSKEPVITSEAKLRVKKRRTLYSREERLIALKLADVCDKCGGRANLIKSNRIMKLLGYSSYSEIRKGRFHSCLSKKNSIEKKKKEVCLTHADCTNINSQEITFPSQSDLLSFDDYPINFNNGILSENFYDSIPIYDMENTNTVKYLLTPDTFTNSDLLDGTAPESCFTDFLDYELPF